MRVHLNDDDIVKVRSGRYQLAKITSVARSCGSRLAEDQNLRDGVA